MANPIGEIIKELAREHGLTIWELAKRVGVYPPTLYGVIYGTKVSRPAVLRVAEYFHRPDLLFEYEKYLRTRKVESKASSATKKNKKEV